MQWEHYLLAPAIEFRGEAKYWRRAAALRRPRVLDVDDVALRRKRRRYGTLAIGLENHRPIVLFDDRTAEVFAVVNIRASTS